MDELLKNNEVYIVYAELDKFLLSLLNKDLELKDTVNFEIKDKNVDIHIQRKKGSGMGLAVFYKNELIVNFLYGDIVGFIENETRIKSNKKYINANLRKSKIVKNIKKHIKWVQTGKIYSLSHKETLQILQLEAEKNGLRNQLKE